jgi:hypothetical protein
MTQLVLWMIMAYGLSNIVVYGSIFSGPRESIAKLSNHYYPPLTSIGKFLQGMTSCMMCFGFHSGWFLSLLVYSPVHEILGLTQYASWFFDAFLASGSVWAINSIIEWFEQNRPNNNQIL